MIGLNPLTLTLTPSVLVPEHQDEAEIDLVEEAQVP